jgi:hypothetical protein
LGIDDTTGKEDLSLGDEIVKAISIGYMYVLYYHQYNENIIQ